MESAGLRRREHAKQVPIPMETIPPPYRTDLEPPQYTIDLSLPPEQRYQRVAIDYKSQLAGIPNLFDEVIHDLYPRISTSVIRRAAQLLLRRLYSAEETAELRGISQVTGVQMYILVAFNVLLDLFMGCTSGGVRVKDGSGNTKMLHFRTLDWGMDVLRKIIVRLDFIDDTGGSIVASSVTYVGFVGVLTGVRKNLSLSLNFRPAHDASTRLINFRFYFHQVLVLLGIRPSISTILRNCLLPSRKNPTGAQFPNTLEAIEHRLPSMATSAAYLIFSNGRKTTTMEKDHRSAVVSSSENFIVALNHDFEDEAPSSSSTGKVKQDRIVLETTGMSELVSCSIDRKKCITKLWRDATAGASIRPSEVYAWMNVYDITNEETHFAMVMDPEAGKILWIKHYLDPINVDDPTLHHPS